MTLVISTASSHGITVVGDRAISQRVDSGPLAVLATPAEKLFYSDSANLAFACWGSAAFDGESYEQWLRRFVNTIASGTSLAEASDELASQLNSRLNSLAARLHGWADLHRGIHVSGYVDDLPCIYHVHTGDPNIAHHPLRVYRDFPDIYAEGDENYRRTLASGKYAQIFNGFHELYGTVGGKVGELRDELQRQFDVIIPAPSLRGQLELSRALVRFAGGLLRAADRAPQVSLEITDVAFTQAGRIMIPDFAPDLPAFGAGKSQALGEWGGGHHTDGPPPGAT